MPSGPPDEPAGNERTACITCPAVTCKAVNWLGSGAGCLSLGAGGCLASSFVSVSCVASAGLSSEHYILRAARMFPSSSLAETACAMTLRGFFLLNFVVSEMFAAGWTG